MDVDADLLRGDLVITILHGPHHVLQGAPDLTAEVENLRDEVVELLLKSLSRHLLDLSVGKHCYEVER
jgi:hypothetical protein